MVKVFLGYSLMIIIYSTHTIQYRRIKNTLIAKNLKEIGMSKRTGEM